MGTKQAFTGVVGRTFEDSKAAWPPLDKAPDGAPNVVIVLLDDVGYAQFGCYGSDIETPTWMRSWLEVRGGRLLEVVAARSTISRTR